MPARFTPTLGWLAALAPVLAGCGDLGRTPRHAPPLAPASNGAVAERPDEIGVAGLTGGAIGVEAPSALDALLSGPLGRLPSTPDPLLAPPGSDVWASRPPGGMLEGASRLRHFFEALERLEAGQDEEDVRIVQFGDSHSAVDWMTGVVRRGLQARFGDGGRGFVSLGKAIPSYVQTGIRVGMTREWKSERGRWHRHEFTGDGLYGLAGGSIVSTSLGSRAWVELGHPSTDLDLAYLEAPRGGSFDVFIDEVPAARVSTRARSARSAFRSFRVPEGPHTVEVRARGDGAVRIFGVHADRSADAGIVFDGLGINGARITTPLHWSETHFAEQLRRHPPRLVILAYGTNESGDDTPMPVYERQLVELTGRIARAVPDASCLFLGPPDRAVRTPEGWVTSERLLEIIRSQRRVAQAAGCAFYDTFQAMGGYGTIARWALEIDTRAASDRVHLTRGGYAQVGGLFTLDLVSSYTTWRRERAVGVGAEPVARGASGRGSGGSEP